MPVHANRGALGSSGVTWRALLLVASLSFAALVPARDADASTAQESSPPTTTLDGVETSATTPTDTTGPCATTVTESAATDATATSSTTVGPCPPSGAPAVAAQQVVTALEEITPDLAVDSAVAANEAKQTDRSVLETAVDAATEVKVDKQPGGAVEIAGAGTQVHVVLPTEQASTPTRRGNVAVFATPERARQAAVAVQPRDIGATVMIVIRSPAEPQTYRFPIRVPTGAKLVPMAGGQEGLPGTQQDRNTSGYVIVDRRGLGIGSIAAPWALDADGNQVDTWYTRIGNTLVQHVDHARARHPVVADPLLSVGCAFAECAVWFSPQVTRALARAVPLAGPAAGIAAGRAVSRVCVLVPHPVARFVCEMLAGVVLTAIAQRLSRALAEARAKSACLRVAFTPLISREDVSPLRFAADRSEACGSGARMGRQVAPVPPGSQKFVNHDHATFIAVGGALFWIPNREQLSLLTGDRDDPWRPVRRIRADRMRRYRELPADGTLFQEVSNSRVYYVSAGHCWYVNAEQFDRRGFEHERILKVPDGGRRQCPYAGDLRAAGRLRVADLVGFEAIARDGGNGTIDAAGIDGGAGYIVVDAGFWSAARKLPAAAVERVDYDNGKVYVDLTKSQISEAPGA